MNKVKEYAKKKDYSFVDIDGIRVEFEDGWALVRASNTGPNITVRFEAKTEARLDEIQKRVYSCFKRKFINISRHFS